MTLRSLHLAARALDSMATSAVATCKCFSPQNSQYSPWGRHVARVSPSCHDSVRRELINTRARLCASFWHVRGCLELNAPRLCVWDFIRESGDAEMGWSHPAERLVPACATNIVVAVARLVDRHGAEKHVARYSNCFRGDSASNRHAEDFLVDDGELFEMFAPGDNLYLYLSLQPCHLSTGGRNMRSFDEAGTAAFGDAERRRTVVKSCTRYLLSWVTAVLAPCDMMLHIRCSDLYRAPWVNVKGFKSVRDEEIFTARVRAARDGIKLLQDHPNVTLDGFSDEDWQFIWSLTNCRTGFPDRAVAERMAHDKKICAFIQSLAEEPRPGRGGMMA